MAVSIYKRIVLGLALCLSVGTAVAQSASADLSVPEYLLGGPSSSLELFVDQGKSLDIISPAGVSYDSGSGDIIFDLFGPFFCFELTDNITDRALLLSVNDANGDPILDGFRPEQSLSFDTVNNRIGLTVPDDGACFYQSGKAFGLSGNAPPEPPIDGDRIFTDRFSGGTDLQIEFVNVPQFVSPNELVSYDIEVRNLGNSSASAVGFQELYPRNPAFYPNGQLTAGLYQCQGFGGADCADAAPGISDPSIRGNNISIPPGGLIRFTVVRSVFAASPVGGTIELFTGAINRSTLDTPSWDSDRAVMTVIGEGQTIAASFENSILPVADGVDQAQIRVTALDNNKNPTPDVDIQVSDADGLAFLSATGTTGPDGSVLFFARTVGAEAAGTYLPEFTAPDIGANGVSTTVSVEFVAGDPSQFSAFTVTDNVIANGIDAGLIEVSVFDALSNPVENVSVDVLNPDGLDFPSSSVTTDANGIASFIMTSEDSGDFAPVFAQALIPTTTSSDISFTAGTASKLVFVVQPSDVTQGVTMSPAVVIHVLDSFDNLVTGDNSSIVSTQLRQSGSVQETFPDVTAVNGVITLSNLVINTPDTDYDLRVFSNYPIIVSNTFQVFPLPQN